MLTVMHRTLARTVLLLAYVATSGCAAPAGVSRSGDWWFVSGATRTDGVIRISSDYAGPKDPPRRCPDPAEWELLTWPELTVVPSTAGTPMPDASAPCLLLLTPTAPLMDRWYALHWLRTDLALPDPGARELRDGTWVWPFLGVTHANIYRIDGLEFEGATFVQVELTEPIDPASGFTWATLFTVTQPGASCTYTGESVTIGTGTIGFAGMPAVQCTGLDWTRPVHMHLEGAVTQAAPRAPVPVLDLDWTFGAGGGEWTPPPTPDPPACTDPRCL